VERELELSLLDALYLVEKGKLEVEDASGSKVSPETLRQLGRETYENFDEVYAVYRDLRDKGLVVKSGMKFGATFVVYRLGPGLEHAPFLVHVLPYNMPTYLPAMGLSLDTLATVALSDGRAKAQRALALKTLNGNIQLTKKI
jgi:tRNA-intron lyase